MLSKIIFAIVIIPIFFVISSSSAIDSPRIVGEPLGQWTSEPVLEICKEAPITGTEVLRSVDVWRELGYPIIDVVLEVPGSGCETGNIGGKIIVELDETVPNPRTYLMVADGEIKWARIKLPRTVKSRVIDHEMGHAVGWNHNDIPGHIMNGSYERGGENYRGLRAGPRYRPPPRSFPGARAPRRGTSRD